MLVPCTIFAPYHWSGNFTLCILRYTEGLLYEFAFIRVFVCVCLFVCACYSKGSMVEPLSTDPSLPL